MHHLVKVIGLTILFIGVALIALGVSLAAIAAQGSGSSGAACVVILFIPICFSWGESAAVIGAVATAASLAFFMIIVLLLRRFLEGLAPRE